MSKPRVLVIDDEPEMRGVLDLGLAQHGFDVQAASDGQAALAILKSG